MAIGKQEAHRPGAFKQTNKAHKTGRHRSKGSISSDVKGKVSVKALSKRVRKNLGKEARRHQSSQIRKRKREDVLQQKRDLGGSHSAPILVCVIPLQESLDVENMLSVLTNADETINVTTSPCGTTHMSVPRFKQRFSIIIPPVGNVFATLDATKVATTVLFVVSTLNGQGDEIIDDWGQEIIMSCVAQGLTTAVVALTNLENLHIKKRQDYKNRVQAAIEKWLPEEKIFQLDTATDALNVLKRIGSQKQRTVAYKHKRPHLLAEEIKFNSDEVATDVGTLMVSGYLRGIPLSVNGLIHIPGLGDFQMSQIDSPTDPYPLETKQRKRGDAMDEEPEWIRFLDRADPKKQESLDSENTPDPMDAEQTWPTEEEMAQAEASKKKKILKKVPKGTSEYQAAWIPDEDGEEINDEYSDEGSEDGMSVDEAKSQEDSDEEAGENEEEYETITVSEAAPDEQKYDQDMDMIEEKAAIEKLKLAKLDAQFPDEVDTPQDMPARIRFQKYRGLESFRMSPWDPKENLPLDYARIFQFENFDRTRKRVFKESQEVEGAMPGWYIKIHVANVRRDLFTAFCALDNRPLIVFGLLPNEHKMSLLNVVLKHTNLSMQPMKSKEQLIFQCGFRRFTACPVFSQHTNGNKHKYERYFRPEMTLVASMYAPITFPPCPVLCYLERLNGSLELIATGSVLSTNPDRIIVKRVVLSGHPFKVHKRSAVVRFMFFHREDINWFKPVELRTKYGRRGHIKDPLGTHGHMKCVFNGQLKSQDTILMNLYKRVFPKWTYEPLLLTRSPDKEESDMNVDQN